jgi:hypothetical protein
VAQLHRPSRLDGAANPHTKATGHSSGGTTLHKGVERIETDHPDRSLSISCHVGVLFIALLPGPAEPLAVVIKQQGKCPGRTQEQSTRKYA